MAILAFVIWLLGWHWCCTYSRVRRREAGIIDSNQIVGISAIVELVVWIWIASLIWGKV